MRLRLCAVIALAGAIAACAPSPTEPSQYAPFSQTDLVVGTGAEATAGSALSVDYTVWLYSASAPENKGALIETSVGADPFVFVLGSSQAIAGWDQGIPGMKEGGRRRLVVPPSLAYGPTRRGTIPPNATLVFEIELISVSI